MGVSIVIVNLSLVFSCLISSIHGLKLPPYIEACSQSDPNLNECAMKSAIKAIPHLVHGEPKYHLPSLEPLLIPQMIINNAGLNIKLTNLEIRGFDKTKVDKINIEPAQHLVETTVEIPVLDAKGDYEISGRILLLPISGKGPISIKAYGGVYSCRLNYTQIEKKGKKYGQIDSDSVDFKIKDKVEFHFENLFGNKELSDQMNTFINENWKELIKEVGPAMSESVNVIIKQLFGSILDKVPIEDIFLP